MLVKSLEQISLCHCCIYILAFITAVPTNHNSCLQDVENRVYLNSCCQFFVKLGKRTRRILLQKRCQRGPQQKDWYQYTKRIYQACSAGGTRSASMLYAKRYAKGAFSLRGAPFETFGTSWNLTPETCQHRRKAAEVSEAAVLNKMLS